MLPAAKIRRLADALVDALNGNDWGLEFQAVRDYAPVLDLEQLRQLVVAVVPGNWDRTSPADGSRHWSFTLSIEFRKKLSFEASTADAASINQALDNLVDLVHAVAEMLLDTEYFDNNAFCSDASASLDRDDLYTFNQFTASIDATFEVNA